MRQRQSSQVKDKLVFGSHGRIRGEANPAQNYTDYQETPRLHDLFNYAGEIQRLRRTSQRAREHAPPQKKRKPAAPHRSDNSFANSIFPEQNNKAYAAPNDLLATGQPCLQGPRIDVGSCASKPQQRAETTARKNAQKHALTK
jgi:hypothetical protein